MHRNQTGSFLEEARKRDKERAANKVDARESASFARRYIVYSTPSSWMGAYLSAVSV